MGHGFRSHPRRVRTVCAFALGSLLAVACGGPRAEDAAPRAGSRSGPSSPSIGDRVAFRLPTLDGEELGPADFPGQVVLLDFWATWCVPCRAQKAVLEEVVPEYPEDALHVLAVDVGEEAALVREFVADEPSPFPVVLDRDTSFFTSLGLVALPSLTVLDAEGRLVEQVTGVIDARRLRTLLGEAGLQSG